jgi:agmatine/peptidylarginine deiminase
MKKLYLSLLTAILFFPVIAQDAGALKVLPKYETEAEINARPPFVYPNLRLNTDAVPADLIMPGEFEESQAVLIAWPYPSTTGSSYNVLWSKLAKAIQQECQVWILIDFWSDSTEVKTYMAAQGTTLTNYRFFAYDHDAFWYRDFGPWTFYYNGLNNIAFNDPHYYDNRPKDDASNAAIASQLGIPNFKTNLYMEGGNFMVDGFGHGFFSSKIAAVNNTNYGWTTNRTYDTIKNMWGLTTLTDLPRLLCDGGTGHIDIYSKLLDEQTLLIAEYPSMVTATDKAQIETNLQMMQSLNCTYNRPFKFFRMPMPTTNTGTYNTTCTAIDNDIRGFVNGLTVNKTFIMPCYSNASSGNVAGDSAAVRLLRKYMPGYNIFPIDSRILTVMGGAIHCITMQIPTGNPIRFWHPSIEGLQPALPNYHLLAQITNKSGIATATCKWRKRGETTWNSVSLTDSSSYFVGDIPGTGFTPTDTIEYYLEANSNNGKTMPKPITAPAGFYTFWFDVTSGAETIVAEKPDYYMFDVFPNPAVDDIELWFYTPENITAKIVIRDLSGRAVYTVNESKSAEGLRSVRIPVFQLSPGMYYCTLNVNNNYVATRRFVRQ